MGVSALQSGVKGLDSTSGPAAYSQLTGFKGQGFSGRTGLSPIESLFWGVKLSQTEILKKDVGGNRRQPEIYSAGMKDQNAVLRIKTKYVAYKYLLQLFAAGTMLFAIRHRRNLCDPKKKLGISTCN